ncbi:MAG: hypothetical protein HFE62_00090 [Firmicutes bacterium]|nr:hypothetical protein [Bacillota bacterium]
MKKTRNLKQKIIFYVMFTSIVISMLTITIMSIGSIRSTNSILLDNLQINARIASQSISSNVHLLSERIYNISTNEILTSNSHSVDEKASFLKDTKLQIEFVWLSAYDANGKKLFGDDISPDSISDTKYFSHMKETQNTVIGDPHYENQLIQLCVGSPLMNDGEISGYIVGSYKYDLLNDILSLLVLGDTGSAYIINDEGTIIADQNQQNIIDAVNINNLYPAKGNDIAFEKAMSYQTGSTILKFHDIRHYVGYSPIPGTNWVLFVDAPQSEFMESVSFSIIVSAMFTAILLIVAAAIIVPLSSKVSYSLSLATKRLQELSDGNLTKDVIVSKTKDEAEILTEALSKTVKSLNQYIKNIQSCLGSLSSGDYTVEITDSFNGDFASIKDALTEITISLNKTMRQVNISSTEVSKNSKEVSSFAKQLFDGSQSQNSVLEQLQESMEYITSTVNQNDESASKIVKCSQNAIEKTSLGDSYIRIMLETMNEINSSMEEISKISKMIESISSQTRILSLNASVEAARAGQSGRGFAVVANEIGRLAESTAEALKQTSEIIEKSSKSVKKGIDTAGSTANAFHEISDVVEEYKEISTQLSHIVKNQINAITSVNSQLISLKDVADRNQSLAEQTDYMAEGFLDQSEKLKDFVSQVKLKNTL